MIPPLFKAGHCCTRAVTLCAARGTRERRVRGKLSGRRCQLHAVSWCEVKAALSKQTLRSGKKNKNAKQKPGHTFAVCSPKLLSCQWAGQ